jgi:hypothetical protein
MKSHAIGVLIVGGVFLSTLAQAAEAGGSGGHVGVVAGLDLEYGGDNVVKVTFTNGSTQNLRAGQGVAVNFGLHYQPARSNFDIAGTIGYKYVTTAADNADIHLDRVVIKLIGSYTSSNAWWVGAGPVWHTGTHFKGDGFVPDVNFSDSTGFTVQVGWRWFGAGYTNMSYSAEAPFRGSVDASSVGIFAQWKG